MAHSNTDNYTTAMPPDITEIKMSPQRLVVSASKIAGDLPPKQGHGIQIQSKPNEDENRYCIPFPKETDCDIASAKRVFGWTTIDEVNLPFIIRSDDKYLSVRMLEAKLLSHFPYNFATEVDSKLVSHRITFYEQSLLNEINVDHCDYEYGKESFTTSDIIVRLDKFESFYQCVKETFPEEVTNSQDLGIHLDSPKNIFHQSHGWLQINNTVTPYVRREKKKYALLPVLIYAAGLMTNGDFPVEIITEVESVKLNEICAASGFDFKFERSTKLVDIEHVKQRHDITLLELPTVKPVENAKYGVTHELIKMSKKFNLDNSLQQRKPLTLPSQKQVMSNVITPTYQAQPLEQAQPLPRAQPMPQAKSLRGAQPLSQQVYSQPYPGQSLTQQELSVASHRHQPVQQMLSSACWGQWSLHEQQQQQQKRQQQQTQLQEQQQQQPRQEQRQALCLGQPIVDHTQVAQSLQRRPSFPAHQPERHIHPAHHTMQPVQSQSQQMPQLQQMQSTRPIWQPSRQRQASPMYPSQAWFQEKQLHVPVHQAHTHVPQSYQSQPTPRTNSILPSALQQFDARKHQHTVAMLLQQKHKESQLKHQFQIPEHQHALQIAQRQEPSAVPEMQQRQHILQQQDINSHARRTDQMKQIHAISHSLPVSNVSAPRVFSLEPIQIPHINNQINSSPVYNQPYRLQGEQPMQQEAIVHNFNQYHVGQPSTTSTSAAAMTQSLKTAVNGNHITLADILNNQHHSSVSIGGLASLTSFCNSSYSVPHHGYQSILASSTSITNSYKHGINSITSDNSRLESVFSTPPVSNSQLQSRQLNLYRPQEHDVLNPPVVPKPLNVSGVSVSCPSDNTSTSSSSVNSNMDFQNLLQIPHSNIMNARPQAHQTQLPNQLQRIQQPQQLQLQHQASDTCNLQHAQQNLSVTVSMEPLPSIQNTSQTENRSPDGNKDSQNWPTDTIRTQYNEKVKDLYNTAKVHSVKITSNRPSVINPVISAEIPPFPVTDGSHHASSANVHSESRLSPGMPGKDNSSPIVMLDKSSPGISASVTSVDCHLLISPITTSAGCIIYPAFTSSVSTPGDQQTRSSQINSIVAANVEGNSPTHATNKCTQKQLSSLDDLLTSQANSATLNTIPSYAIPTTDTTHDRLINMPINDTVLLNATNASLHGINPDASITGNDEAHLDVAFTKVENLSEITKMARCIHFVKFYGKALSCLEHHTRKGKYALVKAIHTLYFPIINLSLLVFFIEKVFQIPTVKCSSTEESAFSQYFGLSVADSHGNKMVELSDLKKHFIWLCKFISSKKDKKSFSGNNDKYSKTSKDGGNQHVTNTSNDNSKTGMIAATKPSTLGSKKRKLSFEGSDLGCLPENQLCLQQDLCNQDSSCIKRKPLATIFTERNSQ